MKDTPRFSVSRRKFIAGGIYALAGGTFLKVIGSPPAVLADTPVAGSWPYTPLDPFVIGQSAWNPPGCRGCGGKSMGAMVYGLRAALGPGSPWDRLPVNIGSFGNGGGPQRHTCGAVIAPYLLMNLVGAGRALGKEFYQWYCDFAFPSNEWDHYKPKSGPPPSQNLVRTVSNSTLCRDSRGTWQKEYNRVYGKSTNKPRNDRCAKLICDCTRKAVELLNNWKVSHPPENAGGSPNNGRSTS